MGAWEIKEDGTLVPLGKRIIKNKLFHTRLLAKKLGIYFVPIKGGKRKLKR